MKILIADDHPLFLAAIVHEMERSADGISVTTQVSLDGVLAIEGSLADFDVVVVDYSMPGMSGVDGIVKLLTVEPDLRVAVMSGVAQPNDVKAVIEAGAKGFIPKTMSGVAIVAAVNLIAAGGTFVPTDYMNMTTHPSGTPVEVSNSQITLTPRESEVLSHIVEGQSNKEIARALLIEEVTVKLHARRIFQKLGVRNRVQAARLAIEKGLALES